MKTYKQGNFKVNVTHNGNEFIGTVYDLTESLTIPLCISGSTVSSQDCMEKAFAYARSLNDMPSNYKGSL